MNDKINKKVIINLEELLKNDAPYLVEDGKINLKKLQGLLKGKTTEKEDDRFYFNWAGKDKVFQAIQSPAYSTLVPQKDKSIDWDNTENLMIVGENLETLKLLLKPYFGKVKVIYIDPPYNTGKDFIYKDDFSSPLKDYLERTGQKDDNGNKLTTNTEASGRYHSDWLNFMYPRLFLARNLLKDDGLIFISIDDNEEQHLKMIMDEIFGEDNFIGEIIVKSNPRGSQEPYGISAVHEYLLCYGKSEGAACSILGFERDEEDSEFSYITEDGRNARLLGLRKRGGDWKRADRPNMYYPIYVNPNNLKVSLEKTQEFTIEALPIRPSGEESRWTWGMKTTLSRTNELVAKKIKRNGNIFYDIYRIDPLLTDEGDIKREKLKSIFDDKEFNYQYARQYIKQLFGTSELFDFPKSPELIIKFLQAIDDKNCVIMDFFAGSGTTGQAIYEINRKDKGNRKFILVQIDEKTDKKSEAYKAGYKTISDICVERLKRVSQKNSNELKYKVFKLSASNFNLKEEFELNQNKDLDELKDSYLKQLGLYVDQPVIPTAKAVDIVYEIILKNGFSLNSDIEEVKIGSNKYYFISDKDNDLEMYICLDNKIKDTSVEKIRTTQYKGRTFAFYDNALTDSQKINLNTFVKLQVI